MTVRRRRPAPAGPRVDPHEPMPVDLRVGMTRDEIYAAYGLTCPPRVGTLRNPARPTYGPAVARVASRLGFPLMPHQRYTLDTALEIDPATRALFYRDVTGLLPRQSGKTTIILPLRVHRAIAFPAEVRRHAPHQRGRQRILYAAQKRIDAREKWLDDQLPILEASPYADRYTKRLSNGNEALLWKSGAYDGITSNTEDAAHGKVLDLGVEDEFFAAVDARLEAAFSPAMITRWSPQHWRVSTEGTEASAYLAKKVDAGRELEEARENGDAAAQLVPVFYIEWSNLTDRHDRPETWLSCMPALCPKPTGECTCGVDAHGRQWWRHSVRLSTMAAELHKHGVAEFCRAYLNRRRGSMLEADPNMPPLDDFRACGDPRQAPTDVLAFGIDMSPARNAAAIVAVWLCDPATCKSKRKRSPWAHPDDADQADDVAHRHWKVVEYRPGDASWVPGRARELDERWQPVAWGLDPAGPAGSLLPDLADVGIARPENAGDPKRGDLVLLNAREASQAFGLVVDGIRADTIRHEEQDAVIEAYGNARTRPLGDALAFTRRHASGDICTLVAGTNGTYALETRKHLATDDFDPAAFWV